jgi:hypothetical protein
MSRNLTAAELLDILGCLNEMYLKLGKGRFITGTIELYIVALENDIIALREEERARHQQG